MRNTPSGITGVPRTPGYKEAVISPVSSPQKFRGPTSAPFEPYKNQGSGVNYEGRSARNSRSK